MRRYVVSAVFLSLMVCSLAFSQGGNAQLGGVVTDPSAALLPGVTVTVTNTETSVTNTVLTNESGVVHLSKPAARKGVQSHRFVARISNSYDHKS